MNAVRNFNVTSAVSSPSVSPVRNPTPPRHLHRERDFGVGYGNSSGYASGKRYAPTGQAAYFRCA